MISCRSAGGSQLMVRCRVMWLPSRKPLAEIFFQMSVRRKIFSAT